MQERVASDGPARLETAWAWAAGLGLAACCILGTMRPLRDPDLPWHLAAGRALLHGQPVGSDAFSYTMAGRPVPYETVSDLLLYAAHGLWPAAGLQLLSALVLAALAWLLFLRCGRPARLGALLVVPLSVAALWPWMEARPTLLGLPVLAAELAVVDLHRRGRGPRWLALLIPLQLLWANVHQFAVLGAGLACLYAAYAWACRLAPGRLGGALPATEGRDAWGASAVAAAVAAATCMSPFGAGLFAGPGRVLELGRYVMEWAPGSPGLFVGYDPALGALALLALAALACGREPDGRRAPSLFDAVLVVGTLGLAFARFRMAPVFALAAAPVAARRLQSAVGGTPWAGAGILAGALSAPLAVLLGCDAPLGAGFDEGRMPEGAVRYIEARRPEGNLFNDIGFGGYLIWRLHPRVRVFIDGRTIRLYPMGFVRAAWEAESSPRAFEALSARYGFEWAVVSARPGDSSAAPLAADPRWAMVYLDDAAAVYVRKGGPNGRLAGEGYSVLRHLSPWASWVAQPPAPGLLDKDAALAVSQAPASVRARFIAAAAALARGDAAAAAAERASIARLAPGIPGLALLDRRLSSP